LGDRKGVAECVAGLAGVVVESEPGRAARLLGAASGAVEARGTALSTSNRPGYDRTLATARARLGDEAFGAAWAAGGAGTAAGAGHRRGVVRRTRQWRADRGPVWSSDERRSRAQALSAHLPGCPAGATRQGRHLWRHG